MRHRDLYPFHGAHREHGKDRRELDNELREVAAETRKRTNNRADTEDQEARANNLRETRGRLN